MDGQKQTRDFVHMGSQFFYYENTDVVMLDDEDEDANTRFVNFKANLNTDEEDEDDIDSRFIPSDADTQYHHGSITEILSTSTGFQNGSLA